jgi:hypothetical protein
MIRRKCKVRITCTAIAYIDFNEEEPVDFVELDEVNEVEDWEVKEVIY